MAEQEPVAAQATVDDDDDATDSKYKPPAEKSMNEIVNLDKDDESLVRYKQALLAGGDNVVVEPDNPSRVIVKKLAVSVDGRDDVEIDLTNLTEKHKIILKEQCEYRIKVYFYVQREIVTGLKYHHVVYRKGIKVDKESYMVGSYGPKSEMHCFTSPVDEAPSGMLARGDYTIKSKFLDDDKNEYLSWEWVLSIKKDFE